MSLENVDDVFALTPMQQGMLYHCIAEPNSGVFIEHFTCVLEGELDTAIFQRCWEQLIARHPPLRTMFLWDGVDVPLQIVRSQVRVPWVEEDWSDCSQTERQLRLSDFLARDRERGFDLAEAPLMRMALLEESPTSWQWIWTFHHLTIDGWSTALVLQELYHLYAALRRGESCQFATPFRFQDYVAWQTAQDSASAKLYWSRQLDGFETPTRLQLIDAGDKEESAGYHQQQKTFSAEFTDSIQVFARQNRLTLNSVLQGAWAILLARYSGQTDIVYGAALSGRPPSLSGIEKAVGLFINTLPFRVKVAGDAVLAPWLQELQDNQIQAHKFQASSLTDIQRWSSLPPGESLFENLIVFENYPEAPPLGTENLGFEIRDIDYREQSNFPLALIVVPADELRLLAVHDGARFSDAAVSGLLNHMGILLQAMIDAPQASLCDLSMLTKQEMSTYRSRNSQRSAFPDDACIHDLIDEAAKRHPEQIAVYSADQDITYGDLTARADQLSCHLRQAGVKPDVGVAVFVDRSVDMFVGILATLKAGGAYIPLDTTYPQDHLQFIIRDANAPVLLTTTSLMDAVPETSARLIIIDDIEPSTTDARAHASSTVNSSNTAYILYTSGSTGRPKGVMVSHRNLMHSTLVRSDYYPHEPTRFLLLSSFAFDSSMAGIFWTLSTGGAIVLPPAQLEQDMVALLDLIASRGITHILCLPSLWQLIVADAHPAQFESVKTAIVAGEICSPTVISTHFDKFPELKLYNEYGPTEATVWSTVHEVSLDDLPGPIPIGRPISNMEAYVIDSHGQPLPDGVVGELCLAGAGLSRGYLNRPKLNQERFQSVRLWGDAPVRIYRTGDLASFRRDGALIFCGRADSQVKIMGRRIELGEIEETLRKHPYVAETVVIAAGHSAASQPSKRLVAYYRPSAQFANLTEGRISTALREHVREQLPHFMMPAEFISIKEIPRTPNGKIDRLALPSPSSSAQVRDTSRDRPRNPVESALASIWGELLDVDSVGIHDNFFEIGGDSIVSIQVISLARSAGIEIEPQQFIKNPTIAQMAEAAEANNNGTDAPQQSSVSGEAPLTPIQHWFFGLELESPHHWNLSRLFEIPPHLDDQVLREAVECCVAHHDALRSRYVCDGATWRQFIQTADSTCDQFAVVQIPGATKHEAAENLEEEMNRIEASMSLEDGRLFQAVVLKSDVLQTRVLLLAAHHLVMDVVSWFILVSDLELACNQILAGQGAQLPAKTTSYRDWATMLVEYSRTEAVLREASSWLPAPDSPDIAMPRDFPIEQHASDLLPPEQSSKTVTVQLDAAATSLLKADMHDAYNTKPVDIVLTAIAQAFQQWTGRKSLYIDLEKHGRDAPIDGYDVSRTIGWFTSCYATTLQLSDSSKLRSSIIEIKEQLRALPNNGLGYGILRYLCENSTVRRRFHPSVDPEVLFNYLGQNSGAKLHSLFSPCTAYELPSRASENRKHHLIEINASIIDGRLTTDWIYSAKVHRRTTIETVANDYTNALIDLISHCTSGEHGGFTVSDFPEADLSQSELDRLLEEL